MRIDQVKILFLKSTHIKVVSLLKTGADQVFNTNLRLLFFLHVGKGQEVENYMCYVATRKIAVTSKQDIPGYSMDLSTNKRVYRKLYSKKYKSSQKLCFKMFRHIQSRDGLEMLL